MRTLAIIAFVTLVFAPATTVIFTSFKRLDFKAGAFVAISYAAVMAFAIIGVVSTI